MKYQISNGIKLIFPKNTNYSIKKKTRMQKKINKKSNFGTGPDGRGNYVIKQGECIESIAAKFNLYWKNIWDAPENASLRAARKHPNALLPGDRVFIPEMQIKEISAQTEQRHKFKKKGVPSKIDLILKDQKGEPRSGIPYILEIDGKIINYKTGADGRVKHSISPLAQKVRLIVNPGEKQEEYNLLIRHLDPITEISGIQGRLNNLGYDCGRIDGSLGPKTKAAICEFQKTHNLTVTGELDEATIQAIEKEYGA